MRAKRTVAVDVWLTVCLNGSRDTGVPVTPEGLAGAARSAVQAGAHEVHLHPRDNQGRESVQAEDVAAAVTAVRAAVPGVRVGVTTAESAGGSGLERADLIRLWTVLPDCASVNWHEDGAAELVEALHDQGVEVEAGLWTMDAVHQFLAGDLMGWCCRILLEPMEQSVPLAVANAEAMIAAVATVSLPVLLHGVDAAAWPVLGLAVDRGLQTRVGLEDVLTMPPGVDAGVPVTNADLVRGAVDIAGQRLNPR